MHKLALLWAAHNEEAWLRRRQRNVNRQCLEKISEMPDSLFIERFRLDKVTFKNLCRDLSLHRLLRGTKEIPLEIKVLCTLSFLATGSFQRHVGVTQHLTQRTASRCISQVVEALNNSHMLRNIAFPQTLEERTSLREEFQEKFNLPGVIGCIDCTHIAIVKPDHNDYMFFNMKCYHSLNVQMICDHNSRILNVNSKCGGATHDSFIFTSSQVEPYMRQLNERGEQAWLLGDSGYPLREWLLTPISDAAPGSREAEYNTRHVKARNCIKQCFGLLKTRWGCLRKHNTLHYQPHVASKIVVACCVLHNIALEAGLSVDEAGFDDSDDEPADWSDSNQEELKRGREMLTRLIKEL